MTRLLLLLSISALAAAAHAQLRTLPPEAKRGQIRHVQEMIVQIDGTRARLSAGAQVRDTHNRILVPSAIPAGSAVKYLVNGQGEVSAVWILTPHEAAR
jgi:hypothetical protein